MHDDNLTPIWKALADPTRRRILDLLKEQPRTTGELCDAFEALSRFAVMKHLTVLETAGLVVVRPQGRERWNHLNAVPLQLIYERWLRPYAATWATRLLQLKQHIEEPKGEKSSMAGLEAIQIEQEVTIAASPERVFEALTREVAAWWGVPYLYSEAARNVILEPRLGGHFYEDWGNNAGILYATVTGIKPAERLELTGPMGMTGAVQGFIAIQLEPKEAATVVRLSHQVIGQVTEETKTSYGQGWQDLLGVRLKAFVETGQRHGLKRQ